MLSATQFNGDSVLNSTASYEFQVGANDGAENRITIASSDISLNATTAFTNVAGGGR